MPKQHKIPDQLAFDLQVPKKSPADSPDTGVGRLAVVPFVDRATLAIRRDAIHRVQTSGIFAQIKKR
jgi:hypothetical protein